MNIQNIRFSRFLLFLIIIILIGELLQLVAYAVSLYFLNQYSLEIYSESGQAWFEWFAVAEYKGVSLILFGYVALGLCLLAWLFKAHRNLSILGASNLKFSDAACVWWFFVPIFNLWKPYQALKETLTQSQFLYNRMPLSQNMGWILLLWWIVRIPMNMWSRYLEKAANLPEHLWTIERTQGLFVQLVWHTVFEIFLSVALFYIVFTVYRLQINTRRTVSLQKNV